MVWHWQGFNTTTRMKFLNPNKIKIILDDAFSSLNNLYDEIIIKWIEENYQLLYEENIDILELTSYLGTLLILETKSSKLHIHNPQNVKLCP